MDIPRFFIPIIAGKKRIDPTPIIYPTFGAELAPASAATSVPTDADATTGWSKTAASTITSVATPLTGSLGSYALDELAGAGTQEFVRCDVAMVAGEFIRWESLIKTIGVATMRLIDYSTVTGLQAYTAYTAVTKIISVIHVGASDKRLGYQVLQAAGNIQMDDVSMKKITFASMLANAKACVPGNVIAGVNITVPTYNMGGLMINLDSMTNPQNGVGLWINVTSTKNIWLKKLVAGVWTTVTSELATLIPNGLLQIRNSGTDYEIWYNGSKVGATQTIADAFTGTNACQLAAGSEVVFA